MIDNKLTVVAEYADVFSNDEWLDVVKCGGITPDDGSGYPARLVYGVLMEDTTYSCWDRPDGYTHVAWYNK